MSKGFKLFLVALAVVVTAMCLYYPYSTGGIQRRNIKMGQDHLPVIKAAIENSKRFPDIEAALSWRSDGVINVAGVVESEEDLAELKRIVDATSPPMKVDYRYVQVKGR